ncbi:MAG TPA: hypothetical protein VFY17_03125, partial [Pilimelia sp.]|nr:hypothetical protein [Pilimelia sp.]
MSRRPVAGGSAADLAAREVVRLALTYCPDTTPADWVVASGTPAMQLINFGPACFAAYARLRFVPDPAVPGQAEADVALPDGHPSDIAQARCALKVLAGYTATADDCYFCLWEGYSDAPLPAAARGGPLVETPYRRYALLRG